ncbi:DUF402 domain-containing protein [Allokutzneria multivorans]|uniref:DUF402 domain-containing protein n=1 Tax=Allokutzneria multivorans TaxID=1142134 RepID=A0ABP7S4N9_9PSEU
MAGRLWAPGEEVLYAFRRIDGSTGSVAPARVLADDGEQLVCWVPDGTPVRTTRVPGGGHARDVPLEQRFRVGRVPVRSAWIGSSTLRVVFEQEWSSVWWFFLPDGTFLNWYVNLEIPLGRTDTAVCRVDGVLDVEVLPDRSWSWKDEDEAIEALAAGKITQEQLDRLRAEGERMIGLAESGLFPFDGSWCEFRPEPGWPLPTLPDEVMEER